MWTSAFCTRFPTKSMITKRKCTADDCGVRRVHQSVTSAARLIDAPALGFGIGELLAIERSRGFLHPFLEIPAARNAGERACVRIRIRAGRIGRVDRRMCG